MEIARVTAWDPTYFVAYRDLVAFYEVDVTLIGFTVVNPLECATLIHFAPHNFALPLLPAPVRLDAPLCRVVSAENFIAFAHALLNLLCQLLHCRYSVYRLYNSLSLSLYIYIYPWIGLRDNVQWCTMYSWNPYRFGVVICSTAACVLINPST